MKTTLTIGFLAITLLAQSQELKESQVPLPVRETAKKMFAAAQVKEWEMEDGNYEVELKERNETFSAVFDASGRHLETERPVRLSEIPRAASEYLAGDKKSRRPSEASRITAADGTITYEVEVGDWEYFFDAKGAFLQKKQEQEETDDKD